MAINLTLPETKRCVCGSIVAEYSYCSNCGDYCYEINRRFKWNSK